MTSSIETRSFRLGELLLTVRAFGGPRILQVSLDDGRMLFAETPQTSWETPYGTFHLRGGHRLWHAPEAFPRSYIPDDDGPAADYDGTTLTLRGITEPGGLRKEITVVAAAARRLTVTHTLVNDGLWPITCAPWAITQLRPGGHAVLPLRLQRHDGLIPDRTVRFWPYTSPGDARLQWFDDCIGIDGSLNGPPAKVGAASRADWLAYAVNGLLFAKIGIPAADQTFAHGCNLEVYFDQTCVELETHGPLIELAPAAQTSHCETWLIEPLAPTTSCEALHQFVLQNVMADSGRY